MLAQQAHPFRRRGERGFDTARVGHRFERREPRLAERRQREARQGLDDTVELEGSEGAWVHGTEADPGRVGRPEPLGPGRARER